MSESKKQESESTDRQDELTDQTRVAKKPEYSAPQLKKFGSLASLTHAQGGSAGRPTS